MTAFRLGICCNSPPMGSEVTQATLPLVPELLVVAPEAGLQAVFSKSKVLRKESSSSTGLFNVVEKTAFPSSCFKTQTLLMQVLSFKGINRCASFSPPSSSVLLGIWKQEPALLAVSSDSSSSSPPKGEERISADPAEP